jgi:ADP-L-glycero-D-manno-heptose 6-epimerase
MIIITGAAGFIGSCLVARLNELGHFRDLIVVDDFYQDRKDPNLHNKFIREWIHRDIFMEWFEKSHKYVDFVFHLGARTDTTEQDWDIFQRLNLDYSKKIWNICAEHSIPLVYASSAATYGSGEHGYNDDHAIVDKLEALNPYGRSKLEFDKWVLEQSQTPPQWAGLKFFNVYGPNEYHKRRMASVVMHGYGQIRQQGQIRLFRSHKEGIADGEQMRDFVYVKDVVDMCHFFLENKVESGLYNVGTGVARSFNDLAGSIFTALGKKRKIEYFDMPEDLREQYQYFTEANMSKLLGAGYKKPIHSLEEGVGEYVREYLKAGKYY